MQKLFMGRSVLFRFVLALLSVAVAIAVRHALNPIVGISAAPFATVTAAVMFSAWLAGTGPAAVATILGLVAADWYFLEPTYALQSQANVVHIVTYLVVCGAALLLSAGYRRSASRYSAELQRREAMGRELREERDALLEAEEKFRAVAEIGSSAIFIHDGERPLYMNRASEELFGYTRDELSAGDMWRMVHPDHRELIRDRLAARFRGERVPERYELKIVTKSGEERWLDKGARLISFEGKPCILVNAFDVTDRKRTEEALRNREEHYRAAIEAGKVGTWEWDIDRNKVIFSDKIYEFIGIVKSVPYVTYERWMEQVHQDDRPRVEAAIQSALESDAKYEAEFRVVQKGTNDVRWVVSTGRVLRDDAGNPLRMLGSAVDVTERHRAEEALRNREEHFRLAIEAGKVGTWEWDIRQNRVFFSDNWYSLTSELDRKYEFAGSGKTLPYMDFALWRESVHEEDRPQVDAAIRSALESDAKYEVEYRAREKGTNEVRWLAGLGRILRDSVGNPLRMIGAAVDVTERRRAEETLRNTEKLAAAGRLAASIAHEINNPLEAVTNLLFLARTVGAPNAEGEEFLATAEEELKRAAHLTKQTLGFYRESTAPTRFNVGKVIDDVLSLYDGRIEAKCVQVKRHYAGPAEMRGMIGEIRQAVSNLIANALDAMPNSGGTLHIRVRQTRHSQKGAALRITVADSGMGIPTDLQERIFEPFFTTKQETGTGLGLWLTKNIVEKHRGSIRVSSSNTGKTGTVFLLTLPLGDSHSLSSSCAA
jgi:PAS domain S-box-containing protein